MQCLSTFSPAFDTSRVRHSSSFNPYSCPDCACHFLGIFAQLSVFCVATIYPILPDSSPCYVQVYPDSIKSHLQILSIFYLVPSKPLSIIAQFSCSSSQASIYKSSDFSQALVHFFPSSSQALCPAFAQSFLSLCPKLTTLFVQLMIRSSPLFIQA